MNRLWPALLPELRQFPASEQGEALRVARDTPPDLPELLRMAGALVLVTVVFLGPFQLRRLRRGLRDQIQRQERP